MFSNLLTVTNTGMTVLLRAENGESFQLTKFVIGEGDLREGETPATVRRIRSLMIDNVYIKDADDTVGTGYIQLEGQFDNYTDVPHGFFWKELGLIATDEDDNEYLYAYAYEGDYPDYIVVGESEGVLEQKFSVIVPIGTSGNITAYIDETSNWASIEEFEEHIEDHDNPHEVTCVQADAAPKFHRHSVEDLDGVLPISKGGTGCTSIHELEEKLRVDPGFVCGVFTGDGTTRKDITLGFKPRGVCIFPMADGYFDWDNNTRTPADLYYSQTTQPGGTNYYAKARSAKKVTSAGIYIEPNKNACYSNGDYTVSADTLAQRARGGAAVTNTGFLVGYRAYYRDDVNKQGVPYFYIAFKPTT